MPTDALPYGVRDIKITPIDATGAYGTMIDLPNARTLSFAEAEEFSDLRGDDQLIAVRGMGPEVTWSLESGGISLDAWAAIGGGTVTETGTAPDTVKTFAKVGTDVRPYLLLEGQAISDSGGDFHVVIYRAQATDDLEGEMTDGEFLLTAGGGRALPDPNNADALYDLVWNEAVTDIVVPV